MTLRGRLRPMSTRQVFLKWAVLGATAAALLVWAQTQAVGGTAGLLQVGDTSGLRPMIEEQLGQIPLSPGPGHDGQTYYAIGLDLDGDDVAPLLDHGAYRYRRILFPLLASAFGMLDGSALLIGMIVVTIAAAAVATGATAATATRLGGSEWVGLAVILNPGVWLSVRLLTGDTVALALMALGLMTVTSNRPRSAIFFAFSTLAKDVYLVTSGGLALSKNRRRWIIVSVPLAVLLAWMTWLTITMGEGFTGRGNLAWPFTGIVDGAANWASLEVDEWFYLGFALLSIGVGLIFGLARRSWMRWSILGWAVLGIISSNWVWNFGNNAARAFAPIAVLVALAAGSQAAELTVDVVGDRDKPGT